LVISLYKVITGTVRGAIHDSVQSGGLHTVMKSTCHGT